VQAAIEEFPVLVRSSTLKLEAQELRFDLENTGEVKPQLIVDKVMEAAGDRISGVHCESLETLKGSVKL
jgi:hypothetical protein